MKQYILIFIFFLQILNADDLSDIFKNGNTVANITFFHYTIDKEDDQKSAYSNAVGGGLKYTTDSSNSLFSSIGFHNSTPIFKSKHKELTSLFNNDKNGSQLSVLSESFLAYKTKNSIFKVGNFLLNTPLMNKDTTRVVPWSYQGISFVINDVFKSSVQINYIDKIRSNTSHIYKIESADGEINNGISMLGFKHHPLDSLDVQLFYYRAPDLYDSAFFQLDYKDAFTDDYTLFCVGLQYVKTSNYDNYIKDVDLIGLRAGVFTDNLDITLNYSKNNGESGISKGYGGLSKIYTSSMIANGKGSYKPRTVSLKTNIDFELIEKQSSEFSIWLTNTKTHLSGGNDYNGLYTHFKHYTNNFTKIYIRYEYLDFEDSELDAKYFRFITSYDF